MKKSFLKRIISCVMALAVIAGTVPAGIQRTKASYSAYSGENIDLEFRLVGENTSGDFTSYGYTAARHWAYVDSVVTHLVGGYRVSCIPLCAQARTGLNGYIAIKVNIPAAGRYRVNFRYLTVNISSKIGLYITPYVPENSVAVHLDGLSPHATVDAFAPSASLVSESRDLPEIAFDEAGEYLFVFRSDGVSEQNPTQTDHRMYLAGLTLDGTPLGGASISLGKSEIKTGETTGYSVSARFSDGSPANPGEITVSSLNPDIARVDEFDGVVIGVSPGETEITATAQRGEDIWQATAVITVRQGAPYSNEVFDWEFRYGVRGNSEHDMAAYTTYGEERNWAYVDSNVSNLSSGFHMVLLETTAQAKAAKDEYVALKSDIPAAGRYRLTMDYYGGNAAGIVGIYTIPLSNEAIQDLQGCIIPENRQLTWDCYQNDFAPRGEYIGDIEFTDAGEHIIIFVMEDKNTSSSGYAFYPVAMEFDGTYGFMGIRLKADKTRLISGESVNTELVGRMTDYTMVDLDDRLVYYESSDARVARASADGVITAYAQGVADITAYLQYDGEIYTDTVTIEVLDTSSLHSIELSTAVDTLYPFLSTQLIVNAKTENGFPLDLSDTPVEFLITGGQPDGAVSLSADGLVTGVGPGWAEFVASVNYDGTVLTSNTIRINVLPRASAGGDVIFDFTADQSGSPLEATIERLGWRINKEKTSELVQSYDKGLRYQVYGIQSAVNVANAPRASDTVFEILIPHDGYYAFEFQGGNYEGAIANIYINDRYMGQYDFCNGRPMSPKGPVALMNSIYLTEGIHTLVIRSVGRADSNANYQQYPGLLYFRKLDGEPTISNVVFDAEKTTLAVGEHLDLNTQVFMSNGVLHRFGKMLDGSVDPEGNMTVTSSDTSVFTVTPEGRVTAIAVGEAEAILTAVVGGETVERRIAIMVTNDSIAGVSAELTDGSVAVGDTVRLTLAATLTNGLPLNNADVNYSFTSKTPDTTVVENGEIKAIAAGDAQIEISASFMGKTVKTELNLTVHDEVLTQVLLIPGSSVIRPDGDGTRITLIGKTGRGNDISLDGAIVEFMSEFPDIVAVDNEGNVTAVSTGSSLITAKVTLNGRTVTGNCYISVAINRKAEPSYYTPAKVSAARENVKKYNWAKKLKDDAIAAAEKYVGREELLWNMVTSQGIPRSATVGLMDAPNIFTCRYCNTNLQSKYGNYPWIVKPMQDPWKIQCPSCRRRFPSNDFGGFYKLGLNERGEFDVELAHSRNAELVAQGHNGYLKNILYPEMGEGWGVDDGFGYRPGITYPNGKEDVHTYIAYYNHWGLWLKSWMGPVSGVLTDALDSLRDAYLYTGEAKYGRTGAILLDRIADVYPGFDLLVYRDYYNSHGYTYRGKILGCIWEQITAKSFASAYDAFFPMMDDVYVVNFLKKKAETYNLDNKKENPLRIRDNCETNLLREIFRSCKNANIYGNFGMVQSAAALAAVVLDSEPESGEWIDWVLRPGILAGTTDVKGGNTLHQLVDTINRDGIGNEAAPQYNSLWLEYIEMIADILDNYEVGADLYDHPKFKKMFDALMPLTLARRATAQIGDSGSTAGTGFQLLPDKLMRAFLKYKEPRLAQILYFLNGSSEKGLHADVFTKSPESVQDEIREIINRHGEYDFDKSENLTGFGFAILRAGSYYDSENISNIKDTQRDFWIYYGKGTGHGHPDALNLGIHAYGLDMAPDMGYPETADYAPNRVQWQVNTISHNTVVVNAKMQNGLATQGTPMHFDDAGRVKVMDIDAKKAYTETAEYRRTLVMVEASDEVSYGIDFFRVNGGNDHLYSFHSQSDEAEVMFGKEGVALVAQPMGSYAGPGVPWGENANYLNGFSWLYDVRKASYPGTGEFTVDFKVKDFRRTLVNSMRDLHLRMTMLNDFELSEVALAKGLAPRTGVNKQIPPLEFVLARRIGNGLDTLFTTVFEPYDKSRYIESLESVKATVKDGIQGAADKVKAVKVTHVDGRKDYIVYATNNRVTYQVDGIDFKGFIGVCTVVGDEIVYSYVNDGTIIGNSTFETEAITGTIRDFTRELAHENSITVTPGAPVNDLNDIIGRYIYVSNDGVENGAYRIKGATACENGDIILDIGDVSPIRKYRDSMDLNGGFIYNIAEGQSFRIPLSGEYDSAPIIAPISEKSVDAGSEIRFYVSAESPVGKDLTYSAVNIPRGASFDSDTKTFFWRPESNQAGKNYAEIAVTDGALTSTVHVPINVFSATSKKTGTSAQTPGSSNNNPPAPDTDTDTGALPDEPGTEEIFIDLNGYDWAKKAIISLSERGIIKGRGNRIFAPGDNISRADLTLLLVRALNINGGTDNFDDVDESKYYYDALSAAKAGGIIAGVGNNRFEPDKEISRQDIIVIISRALDKLGIKLEEADISVLDGFTDSANVSDYAKEHFARLIKNGIIKGAGVRIEPLAKATRAEVAVMLMRIIDIINEI
jgi:uncharacterized protein YjdB